MINTVDREAVEGATDAAPPEPPTDLGTLPDSWDDTIAQEVADSMRDVLADTAQDFYERETELTLLGTALLNGAHVLFLGPPGTGKSALCRAVSSRIDGSNYWEILFDPLLNKQDLMGPRDLNHYKATGKWHYDTEGYFPWAHVVFGDEVGKAGKTVRNMLLSGMQERIVHVNSTPQRCNLITFVGATNEELTDTPAVNDRFHFKRVVDFISDEQGFRDYLVGTLDTTPRKTIPLELIQWANKRTNDIRIPPGVVDAVVRVKAQLRAEHGIIPSDRRWRQSMGLLRSYALLQGRDTVTVADMNLLQHALWDDVSQIDAVIDTLSDFAGKATKIAREITNAIEALEQEFNNLPPTEDERYAQGARLQKKTAELMQMVENEVNKLRSDNEDAAEVEALRPRLVAVRTRILTDLLGIPADRAASI